MRSTSSWTTSRAIRWLMLLFFVAIFAGACGGAEDNDADETGASLRVEAGPGIRARVTVSGVSSGGYMAVQTHIALSDRISGAGIVAGGPYHCAEGSVGNALGRCLSGENLDVSQLLRFTDEAAASGQIAATESLSDSTVWIFHGAKDAVVSAEVSVALADFYRTFLSADRIKLIDNIEAVHGWPTVDKGLGCLEMGGDFINACGFDTAGNLLSHLYKNLEPPNTDSMHGELTTVDFSAYVESGSSLSDTAYIYVPENCADADSSCQLHIAFHGCRQGAEFIEDRFAIASGLNEWAAQNRIIVVYPQIESSLMNPQGCWDWWGYTGQEYDLKAGKQIAAIGSIIGAFAEGRLLSKQ
jgi:hypothetical protein